MGSRNATITNVVNMVGNTSLIIAGKKTTSPNAATLLLVVVAKPDAQRWWEGEGAVEYQSIVQGTQMALDSPDAHAPSAQQEAHRTRAIRYRASKKYPAKTTPTE